MWDRVQVKTRGALPLDAAAMRARLRIDSTAEDDLLEDFLAAAASEIDGPDGVGVALMAQTWTLTLDAWPLEIVLPGWPVTGVSVVRYLDADGAEQTLDHAATLRLATSAGVARLLRKPGASLPQTLAQAAVVEVDYTLGRATAAEVDPGLVTALALLAGHYYENREGVVVGVAAAEVPLGVRHILDRFRRGRVGA